MDTIDVVVSTTSCETRSFCSPHSTDDVPGSSSIFSSAVTMSVAEKTETTTPSSWTVLCRGRLACGGLPLHLAACRAVRLAVSAARFAPQLHCDSFVVNLVVGGVVTNPEASAASADTSAALDDALAAQIAACDTWNAILDASCEAQVQVCGRLLVIGIHVDGDVHLQGTGVVFLYGSHSLRFGHVNFKVFGG